MKKNTLLAVLSMSACLFAATTLSSCTGSKSSSTGNSLLGAAGTLLGASTGTTNKTSSLVQGGANVLGSLLGNLLGASTLNENNIVGTWRYQGIDCVFESENILSNIGGEVAANALEKKIDQQIQKFGLKPGACQFTFKADHTYTATLAGKSLSGTWAYNAKTKQMQMTYLMGVGTLTPKVAYNMGKLSLLFESTKLLGLVQGIGALTNNNTVSSLTGLVKNYNGMYLGLQMTK